MCSELNNQYYKNISQYSFVSARPPIFTFTRINFTTMPLETGFYDRRWSMQENWQIEICDTEIRQFWDNLAWDL